MPRPASSRSVCVWWLACTCLLVGCQQRPASARGETPGSIRVATFNTAMSREDPDGLRVAMLSGEDAQAKRVAEVLQRTRPDIVLLQEVDYDPTGETYDAFQQHYLGVAQNGARPITYPYRYAPVVNTGVSAQVDVNGDGDVAVPQDAHGWGNYPGHYGMVVLSMHPIDEDAVQSFREVRWAQADPESIGATGYYGTNARAALRLSSKTHDTVPVDVAGDILHLIISHPTPPVFDGPEDRNGYRNAAEIALVARMIGALPDGAFFVVLGDLNADPNDGDSRAGAMDVLLEHDSIQPVAPTSEGAAQAALRDAGTNRTHRTDPATDTADWLDIPGRGSGNLRVDYVLPSTGLTVRDSGVYWPTDDDPFAYLLEASDHRLVWVELGVD
ncbi:MAG: endonuclease/exonuclease/phosphatase family protein [Phycisphaerales bacterium JB063]